MLNSGKCHWNPKNMQIFYINLHMQSNPKTPQASCRAWHGIARSLPLIFPFMLSWSILRYKTALFVDVQDLTNAQPHTQTSYRHCENGEAVCGKPKTNTEPLLRAKRGNLTSLPTPNRHCENGEAVCGNLYTFFKTQNRHHEEGICPTWWSQITLFICTYGL